MEGWVKQPSIESLSESDTARCDRCHTGTGFCRSRSCEQTYGGRHRCAWKPQRIALALITRARVASCPHFLPMIAMRQGPSALHPAGARDHARPQLRTSPLRERQATAQR